MFKIIVILLISLIVQQATGESCSYAHCYKEELSQCKPSDSREHCTSIGSVYVTYREGFASLSKHKCCNMTLQSLPKKYLYCVRNIRVGDMKCSSDNSDSYQIKIRTLGGCNKLTCE